MLRASCLLLILAATPGVARSAIVGLTDPAAFNAAISGRDITTTDFDSAAEGTTLGSGTSFGGITFDYSWTSGESLRINNTNATNSGTNYLGATSGTGLPVDLVADGNDISLTPDTPASALGLFIISAEPALDGDIVLTGGGVSVSLAGPALATLADASEVYFLGLVDDTGAEITGSFELDADILAFGLPYRADGIVFADTVAVPEPTSLLGCLAMTTGILLRRRRA